MNKNFATMTVKVAGVTFNGRQNGLWALRKNAEGAYLMLRRETKNDRDPNAIQVLAHLASGSVFCIGYVPTNIAFWLSKAMDEGRIVRCVARKDANGKAVPFVSGGYGTDAQGKRINLGCSFKLIYELANRTQDVEIAMALETI